LKDGPIFGFTFLEFLLRSFTFCEVHTQAGNIKYIAIGILGEHIGPTDVDYIAGPIHDLILVRGKPKGVLLAHHRVEYITDIFSDMLGNEKIEPIMVKHFLFFPTS